MGRGSQKLLDRLRNKLAIAIRMPDHDNDMPKAITL
jgi:hypothetical protein